MRARYRCRSCARTFVPDATAWRCPACGGLFDLEDFAVALPGDHDERRPGLWRHLAALPFDETESDAWRAATMGEGATPLVPLDPTRSDVLVKLDFAMPTLSFKDRGAAVLMAGAAVLGAQRVVVDSSGNAGTAIAAYAARLGIECRVFVPARTSPAKLAQIEAHGAEVELVEGDRTAVAVAAQSAVETIGVFYASHVFQPLFHHGVKTALYEIVEDLGRAPDTLVLPVGNGTYVLGCALAAAELIALGAISTRPRLVAVQAEACAPLAAAWRATPPDRPRPTIAEGIAIPSPPRAGQVLEAVRDSGGEVVTVDDDDVREARHWLARRGLFVEPTAAVTVAAWRRHRIDGGLTVMPVCGAGLKGV